MCLYMDVYEVNEDVEDAQEHVAGNQAKDLIIV